MKLIRFILKVKKIYSNIIKNELPSIQGLKCNLSINIVFFSLLFLISFSIRTNLM